MTKILFLAKETYIWPVNHLIKKADPYLQISIATLEPHEVLLNSPDYKKFKSLNKNIKCYDFSGFAKDYLKISKKKIISKHLKFIEKNYTVFKNLNTQLLSYPSFSSPYHYRDYYYDISETEKKIFIACMYKHVENIIKDSAPDIIFDTDTSELPRHCFLEISNQKNIPYVSLKHSQYLEYFLPRFYLGLMNEEWIKKEFNKIYKTTKATNGKYKLVSNFQKKKNVMSKNYKKIHEKTQYNLLDELLFFIKRNVLFFKSVYGNLYNYYLYKNTPILGNPIKRYLWNYKELYRKFVNNIFHLWDNETLTKKDYILIPLHQIPESSTFTDTPFYLDELDIIKAVSKSVSISESIFVKEHFTMIQERPRYFYKEIKKLGNVKLINPFKYGAPNKYILNAKGVVAINGTTIVEAALLGKPVISFAENIWTLTDSVTYVKDIRRIPEVIKKWNHFSPDYRGLESMMNLIEKFGEDIDIKEFMKMITSKVGYNENSQNSKKLEKLFHKSLDLINKFKYFKKINS